MRTSLHKAFYNAFENLVESGRIGGFKQASIELGYDPTWLSKVLSGSSDAPEITKLIKKLSQYIYEKSPQEFEHLWQQISGCPDLKLIQLHLGPIVEKVIIMFTQNVRYTAQLAEKILMEESKHG